MKCERTDRRSLLYHDSLNLVLSRLEGLRSREYAQLFLAGQFHEFFKFIHEVVDCEAECSFERLVNALVVDHGEKFEEYSVY